MYEAIENMTMADLQNFFADNVKGSSYSAVVVGNKNDVNFEALQKLGKVQEMEVDYLFNYQEPKVEQ